MRISHKLHNHPATPAARADCRRKILTAARDPLSEDYYSDRALCLSLGISEEDWDSLGNQAKRIIGLILPAFAQKFVDANKHYGSGNANALGPAGQFADIWRKIGPLRRALWEGEELTREMPDEICLDLIGHLLLTVDMLQQGVNRRGTFVNAS